MMGGRHVGAKILKSDSFSGVQEDYRERDRRWEMQMRFLYVIELITIRLYRGGSFESLQRPIYWANSKGVRS